MSIHYLDKTPSASIDAALDFGPLLSDATLQAVTWTPPVGIDVSSQSIAGSVAAARLAGGVSGQDYIIPVTASDASGQQATLYALVRVRKKLSAATVSFDSIERLVSIDVGGCPIDTIRVNIAEVAHDFCRDSSAWVMRLPTVQTVPGQQSYELSIPDQSVVVSIKSAKLGGWDLSPGLPDDVRSDQSAGRPQIFDHDDSSLLLSPVPVDAASLDVFAVLAPSLDASRLPAFLVERYRVALADGVKGILMMMPGQTWSNPQLAQYFTLNFQKAVSAARRTAQLGRAGASLRVRPRRFGF